MKHDQLKNIPASIRQRLLDRSRRDTRPFNELLQYYTMERFLFRLSKSRFTESFILKGALLLNVWRGPGSRSTMDIDLLGRIDNSEGAISETVRQILDEPVADDGIRFDPESIQTGLITEDAEYHGIRVSFLATLDSARIKMKIDIGFGDPIFPEPVRLEFPTILGDEAPYLLCYSRESAIAEKFHAMVKLGALNSRMKDFFDIWLLSRQFRFDLSNLRKAMDLTFSNRQTPLEKPEVFINEIALTKQLQWNAFRSRLKLDYAPESFATLMDLLAQFLTPCISEATDKQSSGLQWTPPGPWVTSDPSEKKNT
jgi:predicted nucleotidyltransferase component of viral defense system